MKKILFVLIAMFITYSMVAQNKSDDIEKQILIIEKAAPHFGKMYADYEKHRQLWLKAYKENGYVGQLSFINNNQDWFNDFGVDVTSVDEGKNLFDNKDKIKEVIKLRAKAEASMDLAIEKYSEVFILEEKAKILEP